MKTISASPAIVFNVYPIFYHMDCGGVIRARDSTPEKPSASDLRPSEKLLNLPLRHVEIFNYDIYEDLLLLVSANPIAVIQIASFHLQGYEPHLDFGDIDLFAQCR